MNHVSDPNRSDDVRELLAPFGRVQPVTLRGRPTRPRLRRSRPVLVAAVAVTLLAVAGAAIAGGLGAFNGISTAQHPQTGADVLDAKTLAWLQLNCPSDAQSSVYSPVCHLIRDSARLIGQLPSDGSVFVVTDTRGDLCTVFEGGSASCGPPLSNSQPITFGAFNDSPTTGGTFVATGLAMDDVTSISFTVRGKSVVAPVKNNVWEYDEPDSRATDGHCIVAHLADGSTVNPFPEVPCP